MFIKFDSEAVANAQTIKQDLLTVDGITQLWIEGLLCLSCFVPFVDATFETGIQKRLCVENSNKECTCQLRCAGAMLGLAPCHAITHNSRIRKNFHLHIHNMWHRVKKQSVTRIPPIGLHLQHSEYCQKSP